MFHFLAQIFAKIGSVGIILLSAVGLIQAPVVPPTPALVAEAPSKVVVEEPKKVDSKVRVTTKVEKPKAETNTVSVVAPAAAVKTFKTPSGAIIDANGNILNQDDLDALKLQLQKLINPTPIAQSPAPVPTPAPTPQPASVTTPSPAPMPTPALSPAPVPLPPQIEVVQTSLRETVSDYTFYNRMNKYIGYTSAKVKVWRGTIVNSHDDVSIRVYDNNKISKEGFTVPAALITGNSEESAVLVTVPLTNEIGQYCNGCGHMVIPTHRANYPEDVAAYLRFEINAVSPGTSADRYFIKLISFEGETFGTQPAYPNSGGVIYTF